jgi:hypothetical protein
LLQVENQGPSDIQEAEVYILWPSFRQDGDPLLYLTAQPQVEGPGRCEYVTDVNTFNIKVRLDVQRHIEPLKDDGITTYN